MIRIDDSKNGIEGYLESITLKDNRISLRGWCTCNRLTIRLNDIEVTRSPSLNRYDVANKLGCKPDVGFTCDLPSEQGNLNLICHGPSGDYTLRLVALDPSRNRRSKRRLMLRFALQLLRGSPAILNALFFDRVLLKQTVKTVLQLHLDVSHNPILPGLLAASTPQMTASFDGTVTIVVPVFNAFELLQDCLDRILRHTDVPWRLILIEDSSTDPRVRPWLQDWVDHLSHDDHHRAELIENSQNLGFVRSVNKGLEKATPYNDPVVLLNTDALLPDVWASRLLAPFAQYDNVATVTPMSNDAELVSVPVICRSAALADGQADQIDLRAQHILPRSVPIDLPTGVGFCMAMSPKYLAEIPQFDTAFGPGYGEEVDWCNKISAIGGWHTIATNLFVEHRSGKSFGADQKQSLLERNGAKISKRYPEFDGKVHKFIQSDPLTTERLILALAYLDTHADVSEVPVFIAHSMGGGAENYLADRLARSNPKAAVILRFGGVHRCRIEVHTPAGQISGATDDLILVSDLLSTLEKRRTIYSCAVGDPNAVEIPKLLERLSQNRPLDVLFHDYFPISPSYNLLDNDAIFRGAPGLKNDDPSHKFKASDGKVVSLQEWQDAWAGALTKSESIILFSEDSKSRVEKVYPDMADKMIVQPHQLLSRMPKLPLHHSGKTTIAVLGNIGVQKGAHVLQRLSQKLAAIPDVNLVVIGRIDPAFSLHRSAKVHGGYSLSDIPDLVKKYDVNIWFIPSVWPETFSYTTHEALATGLPLLAFDLGAQGAAVRQAENGIIIPSVPAEFSSDATLDWIINEARSHTQKYDV